MTVDEVRERVQRVVALAGDPESAHGEEDELREAVLREIAEGAPEPWRSLAREALATNPTDAPRWYS